MANDDIVHTAYVSIPSKESQFLLSFGMVGSEVGRETLATIAKDMVSFGTAAIHMARMRGENDNDVVDTFADALAAAQFCLNFAAAMREAAESGAFVEGN